MDITGGNMSRDIPKSTYLATRALKDKGKGSRDMTQKAVGGGISKVQVQVITILLRLMSSTVIANMTPLIDVPHVSSDSLITLPLIKKLSKGNRGDFVIVHLPANR